MNTEENIIEKLYEQYSQTIFKYLLFITEDVQTAEDLTQETFIKAFKNISYFRSDASEKTWLFVIANNASKDYMRKKKLINIIVPDFVLNRQIDKSPLPEEVVQIKETSKEMINEILKMKESYKKVVILRKIKGFSVKETSKILNWSESKVKSTLFQAIKTLEKNIYQGDLINEKVK